MEHLIYPALKMATKSANLEFNEKVVSDFHLKMMKNRIK